MGDRWDSGTPPVPNKISKTARPNYQPFQNHDETIAKTAINSSRPINMAAARSHLAKSLKLEKLPVGPIGSPRPGPIFASAAAAPDIEAIASNPVNASSIATTPSVAKNMTKNLASRGT